LLGDLLVPLRLLLFLELLTRRLLLHE